MCNNVSATPSYEADSISHSSKSVDEGTWGAAKVAIATHGGDADRISGSEGINIYTAWNK